MVARRCFDGTARKLVLPAFGALTGGLDVDHPALVQAVGRRVRTNYDRPWGAGEPRGTQLVVIAEHDRIDPPAIEAVLKG